MQLHALAAPKYRPTSFLATPSRDVIPLHALVIQLNGQIALAWHLLEWSLGRRLRRDYVFYIIAGQREELCPSSFCAFRDRPAVAFLNALLPRKVLFCWELRLTIREDYDGKFYIDEHNVKVNALSIRVTNNPSQSVA